MKEEILNTIRERGLLLEKGVIELLEGFGDNNFAREFLLQIEKISGEKMITMNLLNRNVEFVNSVVKNLDGERKKVIENTFVKLGISLEVSVRKEREVVDEFGVVRNAVDEEIGVAERSVEGIGIGEKEAEGKIRYRVFYADTRPDKKLEVRDFSGHFRARYQTLQRILMNRTELQNNLVSINKISGDRQSVSIIGIVIEKRMTKNGNLIIRFEDLTGSINCLVKNDRREIFDTARNLQLDDVVGIKASGSMDILFLHDIFYPDAFLFEKTKFNEDMNVAFLSDVHCGSDRHLAEGFENFLKWVNSDDVEARKIKYLFFVGDNVDGVGIFPGQEDFLELKSMREQYDMLADYLRRVPKKITMFMCPGQHDACRVAEPQPLISRKYASVLYEIENLVLVTNPTMVKLIEEEKEFKVLMYHGASIHHFINEIKELRELKAHKCPAKAVREMLKRRHLAPSHGEVVYIPNSLKDPLVIEEVPDVLCTGEVHRLDIENYNGVLIITGSCWQAQTDFEEKIGNIPDPCKVPVLNLKTRQLKIYDFGDGEK